MPAYSGIVWGAIWGSHQTLRFFHVAPNAGTAQFSPDQQKERVLIGDFTPGIVLHWLLTYSWCKILYNVVHIYGFCREQTRQSKKLFLFDSFLLRNLVKCLAREPRAEIGQVQCSAGQSPVCRSAWSAWLRRCGGRTGLTFTTDGWFSAAIGFCRGRARGESDFQSVIAIRLQLQLIVWSLGVVKMLCSLKLWQPVIWVFPHMWLSMEYWRSKTFTGSPPNAPVIPFTTYMYSGHLVSQMHFKSHAYAVIQSMP